MSNQLSGQTGPSPRCYRKHERHSVFARVKSGQDQFSAFLTAQATRLSSTASDIFTYLKTNSAARIKQVESTEDLAS